MHCFCSGTASNHHQQPSATVIAAAATASIQCTLLLTCITLNVRDNQLLSVITSPARPSLPETALLPLNPC
jgi:hypothetical protein